MLARTRAKLRELLPDHALSTRLSIREDHLDLLRIHAEHAKVFRLLLLSLL